MVFGNDNKGEPLEGKENMFVTAIETPQADAEKIIFLETFLFPTKGEDSESEYVTAVVLNAPFEFCTIGAFDFQKKVYPSEKSLSENAEKTYEPQYVCRKLTEKQVGALWARAKKTFIKVNQKESVCIADYLIIQKRSEFTINPYFGKEEKQQLLSESVKDETEKFKEILITEQGKKVRK